VNKRGRGLLGAIRLVMVRAQKSVGEKGKRWKRGRKEEEIFGE
jgi:hypothetical protein